MISLFWVFLGRLGSAEDLSGQKSAFNPIKSGLPRVIQTNHALRKENKALKAEFIGLQLEVDRQEMELELLDPAYVRGGALKREQTSLSPQEEVERDDAALFHEVQNLYTSGVGLDLDLEQKQQELKLYDLQYQKEELLSDLEKKEFLYAEVGSKWVDELEEIEREIGENIDEKEALLLEISSSRKILEQYYRETDLLRMENEGLKKKIKHLIKGFPE